MSEAKTLYTMAEIKESVKNLMYKSIKELSEKMDSDFENYIESHAEIELDLKTFESSINTARGLIKKYDQEQYFCTNNGELKQVIRRLYRKQFYELESKVKNQFNSISNRLSKMRNPNTALEFLKQCGIELPEKVQPVVTIDVDPEFIKSILPKQNLLTDGSQEATNE